MSIEDLLSMPDHAVLRAYADVRRQFVEKRFARDTHRARLEWMKAKAFVNSSGFAVVKWTRVFGSKNGAALRRLPRF